ncbi:unnamed protein product [Orchesella dallaii]|uniref:DM13 domain-containing protein n=1 Tax=Orchesella dallaii TaxID=48710 RepID=A0ABP1RA76_9HEXA
MWRLLIILVQFLGVALSKISIGRFQEYAHGLTGEVILLNERQYMIKGYNYDGRGPAVWHTGMPTGIIGVFSEKSYPFQNEKNNCDRLDKVVRNGEVIVTIPKTMSLSKDIDTLAVYCYRFCHNFGHVKIPKGLKLDPPPPGLPDNPLCKPAYPPCLRDGTRDNGVCMTASGTEVTCPVPTEPSNPPPSTSGSTSSPYSLGKFEEHAHAVKGDIYLLNERQYMIKGFYYDGLGPAVWQTGMPTGTIGVYSEKSYPFQNDKNNCDRMDKPVNNQEIIITIPKKFRLSKDIATLAVYCYRFCHNFAHIKIPPGLTLPPAPGNLPDYQLCKPDYPPCTRDATRDNAVCTTNSGQEVTCPVPVEASNSTSTGAIKEKGKCMWTKPRKKKPKNLGKFITYENEVKGEVTIINTRQFRVKGFNYNGVKANSTYFLVMEKNTIGIHSVKGSAVPDENGKCDGLKAYSGQDLIITVPAELRTTSIAAISIYDFESCNNFGHVKVPPGISVPDAPTLPDLRICLPFFRPCSRASTKNNGVCMVKGVQVTC